MKAYAQIVNNVVTQFYLGDNPPGGYIEAPMDVIHNADNYIYINGEFIQNITIDLTRLIEAKIEEINTACYNTIIAGIDSTAKDGATTKHYSLSITDQSNMQALMRSIDKGATSVPWHDDSEDICEPWTAAEFTRFYDETMTFVTKTKSYSDGLCVWAKRAQTQADLDAITWGVALPSDIQTQVNTLLQSVAMETVLMAHVDTRGIFSALKELKNQLNEIVPAIWR